MNPRKSIAGFILAIAMSLCVCAQAAPPLLGAEEPAVSPAETVDLFKAEQHPGSGTLVYRQGNKVELIEMGGASGLYGMGMIFHSSALPEAFQKEFHEKHIIQFIFGTMVSKLQDQVPQFGGVALITKKIPSHEQTFQVKTRTADTADILNLGLVLLTSPATPREQVDEQKLKNTFFSQSGTIILTPLAKYSSVRAENTGSKLQFKTQTMRLEFNAELGTPFNNDKAELQGKVEVPVYWPDGKPAELFAKRIASRSLAGMAAPPSQPPTGITHHSRSLAGSTKKDANPPSAQ